MQYLSATKYERHICGVSWKSSEGSENLWKTEQSCKLRGSIVWTWHPASVPSRKWLSNTWSILPSSSLQHSTMSLISVDVICWSSRPAYHACGRFNSRGWGPYHRPTIIRPISDFAGSPNCFSVVLSPRIGRASPSFYDKLILNIIIILKWPRRFLRTLVMKCMHTAFG